MDFGYEGRAVFPFTLSASQELAAMVAQGGAGNGPNGGGPPGCNGPASACEGDPVDLQTGLFVYRKTDLALPDVLPIQLARTYRQLDPASYAFGVGTMSNYDIYLVGDGSTYSYIDLIQADGGRVHFDRISAGTSWTDAVLECVSSPNAFYGAQIVWNGTGWTLTMKSGTKMFFPESSGARNFLQAALIGVSDRYGNTLTLTRDGNNNLTRVTSPNGRWIQYTYDASHRVTQASDNTGRSVYYTYDSSGRLWTAKDANAGTTTYNYDSQNNMTTIQDARGILYLTNYYDSNNMISKQVMADGGTYLFNYIVHSGGANSEYVVSGLTNDEADVTDPRGNVTKTYFNSDGFMSSRVLAFGKPEQQTFTFSRQPVTGLVLSVTDPLNRQTAFTYDSFGNTTSITRLAGTPDVATTSFAYEPRFNQLMGVTDALGRTLSISYDEAGNMESVTNPDGSSTSLAHNSSGQLISATDAVGNLTQWSYSGADISGITDALQRTVSIFADAGGRVASVTDALGEQWQASFDPVDEVIGISDPLGASTVLAYDPNGNVASLTDALHTQAPTTFMYDNMDRLHSRTDPLGNADSRQYDPNGNLTQRLDRRGKLTVYQYDALNCLTFVGFGTQSGPTYESTISYTWDGGNRLTQANDSLTSALALGYDNLDHVTSMSSPQGSISYTYDAIGRRLTMSVTGQPQVAYSYDLGNRVTQITQGAASVQVGYDALGRRTSLTLPNGVVGTYTYDSVSELTAITYTKNALVLGDLEYTYDSAGRRATTAGNLARTGVPQVLGSNVYNAANQLIQSASSTLSYDSDGNLTSDGLHTYSWNARNQLATVDSGGAATYAYDAFGRRVTKTIVGMTTTAFLYDGWNAIQELSGGAPTATLLSGGLDEYFMRTDSSGTAIFLTDDLGSTLALTDATGAIQTQYAYDPFGSTSQSGESTTNTLAYTGREIDTAGLYFYRARYYKPSTGRFLNEGPAGFAGGFNLYAYVDDNPQQYADPFGLDKKKPCRDMHKDVTDAQKAVFQYGFDQIGKVGIKPDLNGGISTGPFTVDQAGNVTLHPFSWTKYEGFPVAPDIPQPMTDFNLSKDLYNAYKQGTELGEKLGQPLKDATEGCSQ
jgi:RHS repeat-associated protein